MSVGKVLDNWSFIASELPTNSLKQSRINRKMVGIEHFETYENIEYDCSGTAVK